MCRKLSFVCDCGVSMERKAAGQSFGNDGGGRVGHDTSKERNKRKPQL